ncbi:tetratricopeptide repeat protein [Devosia sp.]|uniref:tetratricopeptide repeat protein n=1 Tax=Devosia sp. TaxID=1871048 RepID=UPI002AFFB2DB|nr:cellulose synthase [Devosia sp.]
MARLPVIVLLGAALGLGYVGLSQPWVFRNLSGSGTPAAPAAAMPTEAVAPLFVAQAVAQPARPDETALRYFARQGDTVRLQREIERLRGLYPGWEPPADPLADDYAPDQGIIDIWDLYGAGDYAAARAAIAAKQAADPSFVPSPDLLASLALGEAGLQLRSASDAGQYDTVISVAANHPDLLVCTSVDNLWRLAEAFVRRDRLERALDSYRYILANCTDGPERYATMQKAADLLDRADLDSLMALERPDADGRPEFAPIRIDLARRAVAAALEEDGAAPSAADLALFEQHVADTNAPDDLRLLGYYNLDANRANEARRLFLKAFELDPSAASAEGLGVAYLRLRDFAAAESTLADYRDDSDALGSLYLDASAALLAGEPRVTLDGGVLGRIVDAVMVRRSANTAQELGWYAYAFQQPQTAAEWFTLALRWQPDLEPAAYGLLVASDALGDAATVTALKVQWSGRSARISTFGQNSASSPIAPVPAARSATSPQRSASSGSSSASSSSAASCTGFVPPASLSPEAAQSRAWCMMGGNRPAQAVDLFARALQSPSQKTRSDAAYGQALAYVRMGLASEASVAAAAAPLSREKAIELDVAILTLRATSAYSVGDYMRALDALELRARYAPERNDLLTLRAWSYYHLRRYREALQIFSAVAATGHGDAAAGLAATEQALQILH